MRALFKQLDRFLATVDHKRLAAARSLACFSLRAMDRCMDRWCRHLPRFRASWSLRNLLFRSMDTPDDDDSALRSVCRPAPDQNNRSEERLTQNTLFYTSKCQKADSQANRLAASRRFRLMRNVLPDSLDVMRHLEAACPIPSLSLCTEEGFSTGSPSSSAKRHRSCSSKIEPVREILFLTSVIPPTGAHEQRDSRIRAGNDE